MLSVGQPISSGASAETTGYGRKNLILPLISSCRVKVQQLGLHFPKLATCLVRPRLLMDFPKTAP